MKECLHIVKLKKKDKKKKEYGTVLLLFYIQYEFILGGEPVGLVGTKLGEQFQWLFLVRYI